jgi:hypothetical protein
MIEGNEFFFFDDKETRGVFAVDYKMLFGRRKDKDYVPFVGRMNCDMKIEKLENSVSEISIQDKSVAVNSKIKLTSIQPMIASVSLAQLSQASKSKVSLTSLQKTSLGSTSKPIGLSSLRSSAQSSLAKPASQKAKFTLSQLTKAPEEIKSTITPRLSDSMAPKRTLSTTAKPSPTGLFLSSESVPKLLPIISLQLTRVLDENQFDFSKPSPNAVVREARLPKSTKSSL